MILKMFMGYESEADVLQVIDHPRSGVVYNFGRVCLSVCMSVRQ